MKNLLGRPKVGVLVNNLASSQLAYYLLKEADLNKAALDIQVFQIQATRPCIPAKCGLFNIGDAYGFTGPLIATSLETAEFLANCALAKHRYFYVWDLYWTRLQYRDYERLKRIFRGNSNLIVRSESHKELIERCWNACIIKVTDNFQGIFTDEGIIANAETSALSLHA